MLSKLVVRADNHTFTGLRPYFSWDHSRLDALLEDVLHLVEKGETRQAEKAFGHYARGVRRHFRLEEEVVAQLYAHERTGASKSPMQSLMAEHASMLELLDELHAALAAADVPRFRAAHGKFLIILPAHEAMEEKVLYPYLDSLLGADEAQRLVTRLRAE